MAVIGPAHQAAVGPQPQTPVNPQRLRTAQPGRGQGIIVRQSRGKLDPHNSLREQTDDRSSREMQLAYVAQLMGQTVAQDLKRPAFAVEKHQSVTFHRRGINAVRDFTKRIDVGSLAELARIGKIPRGGAVKQFQAVPKSTDQQPVCIVRHRAAQGVPHGDSGHMTERDHSIGSDSRQTAGRAIAQKKIILQTKDIFGGPGPADDPRQLSRPPAHHRAAFAMPKPVIARLNAKTQGRHGCGGGVAGPRRHDAQTPAGVMAEFDARKATDHAHVDFPIVVDGHGLSRSQRIIGGLLKTFPAQAVTDRNLAARKKQQPAVPQHMQIGWRSIEPEALVGTHLKKRRPRLNQTRRAFPNHSALSPHVRDHDAKQRHTEQQ